MPGLSLQQPRVQQQSIQMGVESMCLPARSLHSLRRGAQLWAQRRLASLNCMRSPTDEITTAGWSSSALAGACQPSGGCRLPSKHRRHLPPCLPSICPRPALPLTLATRPSASAPPCASPAWLLPTARGASVAPATTACHHRRRRRHRSRRRRCRPVSADRANQATQTSISARRGVSSRTVRCGASARRAPFACRRRPRRPRRRRRRPRPRRRRRRPRRPRWRATPASTATRASLNALLGARSSRWASTASGR